MPTPGPQSRPTLLRQLGLVSATALVVSNMIGTGIFTGTGFLAAQLGSPELILWIYVLGGICAFMGAMCYAELGVNFPSSGGEYVYLTKAFGPTWGFMTGWASFFAGFSAPIATAALAFSEYLGHFYPSLQESNARVILGSGEYSLRFGGAQVVACILVALFTLLNVFGVQRAARVQNVLTGLKVIVLLAFIILGFTIGDGHMANLSRAATRDVATPLVEQFAISLVWVYVAYSGWNAATYVAEELRRPSHTLPLALGVGTVLVTALYLALNTVFMYAAPLDEMKNVEAVGSFAASHLFGPVGAGVFAGLMAMSLMSTVNAMVTIGPRVYFAMARNGAFPAVAAKVHPRFHTPVAAIVAQAVATMLMTMTPFPQLVLYIGMTLNIFTVMSVLSIFHFRRRPGWQKLRAVSFAYPAFPVLFAVVGIWMTYQGIVLKPYIALATFLTLLTGAAVYHFKIRTRAPEAPTIETY
ncbi:MAG: amino acid permease [Acidobacteriota bacterium]